MIILSVKERSCGGYCNFTILQRKENFGNSLINKRRVLLAGEDFFGAEFAVVFERAKAEDAYGDGNDDGGGNG